VPKLAVRSVVFLAIRKSGALDRVPRLVGIR